MNILFHKNEKNSYHKHKKLDSSLKSGSCFHLKIFAEKTLLKISKKKVVNETFFYFPFLEIIIDVLRIF
jgi:hypothetical protein